MVSADRPSAAGERLEVLSRGHCDVRWNSLEQALLVARHVHCQFAVVHRSLFGLYVIKHLVDATSHLDDDTPKSLGDESAEYTCDVFTS